MKSILCGIAAIAIMSLVAWAIAPWILLLWFTRNYQVEIKPKSSDFPFETVEAEVKSETETPEVVLEDYWQDDEPVFVYQVDSPAPVEEIQEIPKIDTKEEEPSEVEPTLVFPPCPNLQEMTMRQLQLLCGDINKVKRGSITGYRNKRDKDRQLVVDKINEFYQTV